MFIGSQGQQIQNMAFKLGVHYQDQEPLLHQRLDRVWWRYSDQPLSLQLYSEYRSTYKWHEVGSSSSSNTNAANTNEVVQVVKRPPKPISGKIDSGHFWSA